MITLRVLIFLAWAWRIVQLCNLTLIMVLLHAGQMANIWLSFQSHVPRKRKLPCEKRLKTLFPGEQCINADSRSFILILVWPLVHINRWIHAFSNGFLHRDIKPDNFFVDRRADQVCIHMLWQSSRYTNCSISLWSSGHIGIIIIFWLILAKLMWDVFWEMPTTHYVLIKWACDSEDAQTWIWRATLDECMSA